MTNQQRHFSNALHSAASHLPTEPWRLPFFFPPRTTCRTQLHIRASQTRGPLWDMRESPLEVHIHYPARQNLSPFTTICSTCFRELLSRTQARSQEVSAAFGDLLYTSPYAEMNPLRKYRLWEARNVRKGI